jgi:long-chain fatty acid transport protein
LTTSSALSYNIAENVTCATQYEVPFEAGVAYKDDSLSYANSATDIKSAPISTNYNSKSLTVACGYDMSLSTGSMKVFGGPKIQQVKGSFDEDITPNDAADNDNLLVELDGGTEAGYILGLAYEIPDIALRASILYHSQIDYTATGTNKTYLPLSLLGMSDEIVTADAKAKTFTPQTIEIAFQSGIAENTLAFLKMRWSEYSKLATLSVKADESTKVSTGTTLAQINQIAQANGSTAFDSLINPEVSMFSNDTLDYSFGLGRRFSDQLTLGASFSGSIKLGGKSDDTPVGADSTSLRLPGDTSHTLSLGGEYTVIPKLKVSGGFGYTFINDYVVQTTADQDTGLSAYRAEFSKTEATSFQLGLTYEI